MFKILRTLLLGPLASFYAKVPPIIKRKPVNGEMTPYQKFIAKVEAKIIYLASTGSPKLMKKLFPSGYLFYLVLNHKYPPFIISGFNNFRFQNKPVWHEYLPSDVAEEISSFDIDAFVSKYYDLLINTASVQSSLCMIYPATKEVVSLGISDDYEDILTDIASLENPELARLITTYVGFDIKG